MRTVRGSRYVIHIKWSNGELTEHKQKRRGADPVHAFSALAQLLHPKSEWDSTLKTHVNKRHPVYVEIEWKNPNTGDFATAFNVSGLFT